MEIYQIVNQLTEKQSLISWVQNHAPYVAVGLLFALIFIFGLFTLFKNKVKHEGFFVGVLLTLFIATSLCGFFSAKMIFDNVHYVTPKEAQSYINTHDKQDRLFLQGATIYESQLNKLEQNQRIHFFNTDDSVFEKETIPQAKNSAIDNFIKTHRKKTYLDIASIASLSEENNQTIVVFEKQK